MKVVSKLSVLKRVVTLILMEKIDKYFFKKPMSSVEDNPECYKGEYDTS